MPITYRTYQDERNLQMAEAGIDATAIARTVRDVLDRAPAPHGRSTSEIEIVARGSVAEHVK